MAAPSSSGPRSWPNAPVTAALVVAALAYTLLGGLISPVDAQPGRYSARGRSFFGVAMGAFGMFFACMAAVTAQVTEHNRAALGLAGVALGVSYVLRAIGDVERGRVVVALADGVGTVHQAVRRGSVAAAARSLRSGRRRWWCLPTACRPAGTSAPGCCRPGPVRRLPRPASAGRLVWRSGCKGPASLGGRWPSLSQVWPTDRSPRTSPIWWVTTTHSRSSSPKQAGASSTRSSPRHC